MRQEQEGGASFAQRSNWGEALIQLRTETSKAAHARRVVESFLQRSADTHNVLMQDAMEMDDTAPEAKAYEGQSGGVLDMVKKLGEKFEGERDDLEKDEMNE